MILVKSAIEGIIIAINEIDIECINKLVDSMNDRIRDLILNNYDVIDY